MRSHDRHCFGEGVVIPHPFSIYDSGQPSVARPRTGGYRLFRDFRGREEKWESSTEKDRETEQKRVAGGEGEKHVWPDVKFIAWNRDGRFTRRKRFSHDSKHTRDTSDRCKRYKCLISRYEVVLRLIIPAISIPTRDSLIKILPIYIFFTNINICKMKINTLDSCGFSMLNHYMYFWNIIFLIEISVNFKSEPIIFLGYRNRSHSITFFM